MSFVFCITRLFLPAWDRNPAFLKVSIKKRCCCVSAPRMEDGCPSSGVVRWDPNQSLSVSPSCILDSFRLLLQGDSWPQVVPGFTFQFSLQKGATFFLSLSGSRFYPVFVAKVRGWAGFSRRSFITDLLVPVEKQIKEGKAF